jgi:hypothetical protein
VVASGDGDAMTIAPFTRDGEKNPQRYREILFDIGGDHSREWCSSLNVLHLLIEACQHDDSFDAVVTERPLELPFRVGWIQRRNDRSNLPGGELRDYELRAVGEEERDTVARPDSQSGEC